MRNRLAPHRMIALLLVAILVTACGKKPNAVEPPEGLARDPFPQVYPDPATDPK